MRFERKHRIPPISHLIYTNLLIIACISSEQNGLTSSIRSFFGEKRLSRKEKA